MLEEMLEDFDLGWSFAECTVMRVSFSALACSVTEDDEGAKLTLTISIIPLCQDGRRSDLYRKCSLHWR